MPVSKSIRIALIEPDSRLRRAFASALTSADFVVASLSSAEELLEAIGGGARFDLVLSELSLPGASGAELLGELTARDHPTARRLVLMTGKDVRPDTFSVPVLIKPFDLRAMTTAFRAVTQVDADCSPREQQL